MREIAEPRLGGEHLPADEAPAPPKSRPGSKSSRLKSAESVELKAPPRDETAEEIRQPKRHEEGIGRDAGAEGPGDHEVAQEPEDPAGQGGGAHHGGRARDGAAGAGGGR